MRIKIGSCAWCTARCTSGAQWVWAGVKCRALGECLPGACPARYLCIKHPIQQHKGGMFARRATFLLTILTSARDLPSDGEGPPNRP